MGCAIALPIARELHEQGCVVHSVVGFRSKDLLILEDEFKACSDELRIMTDDGSYGTKGGPPPPPRTPPPHPHGFQYGPQKVSHAHPGPQRPQQEL